MENEVKNIRYISHEIKNQLSICDLYAKIIEKYCEKNNINDEIIKKALICIQNSVLMAGNSLAELKSLNTKKLEKYNAEDIIKEAYMLSKVYGIQKDISIKYCSTLKEQKIYVDKNQYQAVIINLVKNACEAFENEKNKEIEIITNHENNKVKVIVKNNAKPIEKINLFKEGETTKETGSGLGLYISHKNIKEMQGELKLVKSDKFSTEFAVIINSI